MSFDQFVNFEPTQDYEQLKQHHLKAKTLFKDPAFPPDDFAIQKLGVDRALLKWKRPEKIASKPKFFSDGAERFDVQQGKLGDCWLLAAVANLTLHKEYLEHVVPSGQSFDKKNYAGIFHFRFWQYGKWVDVVVDDRLPTEKGRLVLMHSAENNEFWSALLEKAYAKLHGSYGALEGGHTSEAMEDFTGGLSERYNTKSESCPENLFSILFTAHQRGSFMSCSVYAESTVKKNDLRSKGIITYHAYSITSVKQVVKISHLEEQNFEKTCQLIRLRNPWGNQTEWNGPWSDKSAEWASVSLADKKRLGFSIASDGEFWMPFDDFKQYFEKIEVTNLSPDQLEDKISTRRWVEKCFEGQWVPGVSAGGSRKFRDSFFKNPQYLITLNDPDEDDDDDLCTFVVSVMQKYNRKTDLHNLLGIGFAIYKVNDSLEVSQSTPGSQLFDADFFRQNRNFVAESKPVSYRGISERFRLKPGRYCIVPSTYAPNEKREFLLRYFTEKAVKVTRKSGEPVISLTNNMERLTLYSNTEMKKEDDAPSCKDSHLWDHFIWSKVDQDDGEYKFVRGEFKSTVAKANQCQFCNLWFSSTYFFNHFKHCVFDANREDEFACAKARWKVFGAILTEDMQVSFTTLSPPKKGCRYQCNAPQCTRLTIDLQSMKEHIWMRHTKEQPYRCTECASAGKVYKFSKSAALEAHIKSVHMPIA